MRTSLPFAATALAVLASSAALAVDGVIEINQARALAGSVTTGDTPGFPVTLSQPGSYRLTSNLDIRGLASPENITVISVTADDVTIDMNGFSILGSNSCSGTPVTSCALTGTGTGINNAAYKGLHVSNGTVRGMGNVGVYANVNALVERVHAEGNRYEGITVTQSSIVTHCLVVSNGGTGIGGSGLYGGSISFTTAKYNGGHGIDGGQNSVITDCNATRNGSDGIHTAYGGATIKGNVAYANIGAGISTGSGNPTGGTNLVGNTARNNTGVGLSMASNTAFSTSDGYAQNVLSGNNGVGAQVSGGFQMGTNVCNGAACP